MKRLRLYSADAKSNQDGFIPLLLSILAIVVIGIVLVYLRVAHTTN